jgi:hypothetical protein
MVVPSSCKGLLPFVWDQGPIVPVPGTEESTATEALIPSKRPLTRVAVGQADSSAIGLPSR